jgi:hypothetical protein
MPVFYENTEKISRASVARFEWMGLGRNIMRQRGTLRVDGIRVAGIRKKYHAVVNVYRVRGRPSGENQSPRLTTSNASAYVYRVRGRPSGENRSYRQSHGLQTQSQRLTNSKPAAYNIKSSGLQHQRPSPIIPRDSRGKKNPRRSRAKSRAPTAHIVKRNSRSRHSDIQIFRHSDIRMMHRRGYRKVSAANYREVECC